MHIQATVIIDRPIREVFACAADPDCWPDWSSGMGRTPRGYERPLDVGTIFVLDEEDHTYGRESWWEVTEYAPPRVLGCRRVSGGSPATVRQVFEAVNGSTRVALDCVAEDGAPFTGGREVERAMVDRLTQELIQLKQFLEDQHPAIESTVSRAFSGQAEPAAAQGESHQHHTTHQRSSGSAPDRKWDEREAKAR